MSPLSPLDDSFLSSHNTTDPVLSRSHSRRTRTSQSCRECSRRKIKCDRNLPCKPCVERGEADLCRKRLLGPPQPRARLAQHSGGSSISPPAGAISGLASNTAIANQVSINASLQEEVRDLRDRLSLLESTVARTTSHRNHDTHKNDKSAISVTVTSHSTKSTSPEYENAFPTADGIEDAALGIGNHKRRLGLAVLRDTCGSFEEEQPWFQPIPFAQCVISLPPKQVSDALVEYFFDKLNWLCGVLHRPAFMEQYAAFWADWELGQPPDDSWLSVLFAVLSESVFFLEEEDLERLRVQVGFLPDEQHQRGSLWFDCSVATIFRCQGLARPSLGTIQAIVVLHYSFHLSGKSRIHKTMIALALDLARTMNLNLLGEGINEVVGSKEDLVRREMGRRVWWFVVEVNWCFLPYFRYTSIAPHQFDTSLPSLTDNNTPISDLPRSTPHSLSYFLASCHSSHILYDVYGTLRHDQKPSYDTVFAASHRLDSMIANLPPDLQAPTTASISKGGNTDRTSPFPSKSGLPGWQVSTILNMLLAYRSYMIHRTYFWRALQPGSIYQLTRIACVKAAETILNLAELDLLPPRYYRLWNTSLYLTAAGIVLALDLAFNETRGSGSGGRRGEEDKERMYARLEKLRIFLETDADLSGIATRGALTIDHLCSVGRSGGTEGLRKLRDGQDPTSSDYQPEDVRAAREEKAEGKVGDSKMSLLYIEKLLQTQQGYNDRGNGERVNSEAMQSTLGIRVRSSGTYGGLGNEGGINGVRDGADMAQLHQHQHHQQHGHHQQEQNGINGQGIDIMSRPVAGVHGIEQYPAGHHGPNPLGDGGMMEIGGNDWLADFENQWVMGGDAGAAGGMGMPAAHIHGGHEHGLHVNGFGGTARGGFGH